MTVVVDQDRIIERRDVVRRMTLGGVTARDIAAALGVTKRTVERDRGALGLCGPRQGPYYTDDERARALELLADGCSHREVAKTLGRSRNSIKYKFRGHGRCKGGRLEAAMRAQMAALGL